MRQQHTEILGEVSAEAEEPSDAKDERRHVAAPEKPYGFVAVCAGEGLANVFRELGADEIIRGGQTMNPSTEDILRAIDRTPAETVYVLPNNKNIILAAQQCVELAEGKRVIVLQAKTAPQGISAMLNMDYEGTYADNTAAMEAAMAHVTTMEITYAARDSEFDGNAIRAGDYLALLDNQLFGTEEELDVLQGRMAAEIARRGAEFITIFYGEGVDQTAGEETMARFQAACPEAEITLLNGGQPVYSYLISAE